MTRTTAGALEPPIEERWHLTGPIGRRLEGNTRETRAKQRERKASIRKERRSRRPQTPGSADPEERGSQRARNPGLRQTAPVLPGAERPRRRETAECRASWRRV